MEAVAVDDKIENSTVQGYRGIHVIVVVSVFFQEILYENIKVEIQLRTAFQNAWSMKTHELTYKKENSDIEEIQSTMRELSEVLYEADKIENQNYRDACRRRGDKTYWSTDGLRYTSNNTKVYK